MGKRTGRSSGVGATALAATVLSVALLAGPAGAIGADEPSGVSPPPGGTVIEGEALTGAVPVSGSDVHGGASGRLLRASIGAGVPAGTYLLTARVKAAGTAARVDLLTGDGMAGSYGVTTTWETVTAVVGIASTAQTVGAGSWHRYGATELIDVDWLHLAAMPHAMSTRGNSIVNAIGAVYTPKGVNRGGFSTARTHDGRLALPPDEGEAMYVWGANMVRIGLNQEHWLADCPAKAQGVPTTYRAAVAEAVNTLASRGVFVMLSLIGTERGQDTGCAETTGVLREMADERSLLFWDGVAQAFHDNRAVVFDLFNEPRDISPAVWHDGGTVTYEGGQASYTAVGMQALYDTVRATGATNLIFVSGRGWAADPKTHLSNPLDGYGIVAASHRYCHECPDDAPALDQAKMEVSNSAELRARHPLTITETGWHLHTSSVWNREVIDWADARSVGWLIHAWLGATADKSPDRYSIVESVGLTFDAGGALTRKPARSGAPVWNELAPWRLRRGYEELPQPE